MVSRSLFRRLLGSTIDDLPPVLRAAHDSRIDQRWRGMAQVEAHPNQSHAPLFLLSTRQWGVFSVCSVLGLVREHFALACLCCDDVMQHVVAEASPVGGVVPAGTVLGDEAGQSPRRLQDGGGAAGR